MGTRQFLVTIDRDVDVEPEEIAFALEEAHVIDPAKDACHVTYATAPTFPDRFEGNTVHGYTLTQDHPEEPK